MIVEANNASTATFKRYRRFRHNSVATPSGDRTKPGPSSMKASEADGARYSSTPSEDGSKAVDSRDAVFFIFEFSSGDRTCTEKMLRDSTVLAAKGQGNSSARIAAIRRRRHQSAA